MRIDIAATAVSVGAAGLIAAFMCAAAPASADPGNPLIPPPPPPPAAPVAATAGDVAVPPPAPDPLAFLRPPPPAPAPADPAIAPVDPAIAPVDAPLPTPPDGMEHLASPDALPPGTTMDPATQGNESPNVSYLKDLWHAVQNQDISGKEAVIMGLAQRGMNTPYPEQGPGPNVPNIPNAPVDPAAAPPPVAPAEALPPAPTEALPPAPAAPPPAPLPPPPAPLPAPPGPAPVMPWMP